VTVATFFFSSVKARLGSIWRHHSYSYLPGDLFVTSTFVSLIPAISGNAEIDLLSRLGWFFAFSRARV